MKVIFNCTLYKFHTNYYTNIANELTRRGHRLEFAYDENKRDADFTITADEYQKTLGGRCVWIGHSFDAKGAMWNDPFYLNHLQENADFAFVYSKEYKKILRKYFTKPIYVSGMSRLDGFFNLDKKNECILYAPTFNKELSADNVLQDGVNYLYNFGNIKTSRHPAFSNNDVSTDTILKEATVVISDYSSVGMESIVLDIPTILVKNKDRKTYKTFPDDNYICNRAREAAIEVDDVYGVIDAIQKYKENKDYLKNERMNYGKLLCEYQNVSAKRTVDLLESLL